MTDTGIFCTGNEVKRKAGEGANSTATAEEYLNDFISQAESQINAVCRYNFSDNYSSLNDDVKKILKEVASNLAAIYVIQYDMGGYGRLTAESMINVLRDSAQRGLSILRDKKVQEFIKNA